MLNHQYQEKTENYISPVFEIKYVNGCLLCLLVWKHILCIFSRWARLWASLRKSWVWPFWQPGRPSLTWSPAWSWLVKVWGTWLCPARWAATSLTSLSGEWSWQKKIHSHYCLFQTTLTFIQVHHEIWQYYDLKTCCFTFSLALECYQNTIGEVKAVK